ncbi:hypothetical protein SAMN04515668_3327 [Hymenobacter arizonensis]|uniref:Uncharacterized protein n=1 Tax=Hymenobacter arizonensis TaxID=1227077 RepID=A0A1I5ZZ69_HYMAR|nr:hypothetical protein SAMN04515668_3327 [Hymenobacter arizonensis]
MLNSPTETSIAAAQPRKLNPWRNFGYLLPNLNINLRWPTAPQQLPGNIK